MAEFVPSPGGFLELLRGENGPVYRDTTLRAIRVMSEAKRRCPVRSGRLRGSIRIKPEVGGPSGFAILVGTDVDYAAAVHEGTRPHLIVPRNARALHFKIGDQDVFATVVHHPGTKPRRFLTEALEFGRI